MVYEVVRLSTGEVVVRLDNDEALRVWQLSNDATVMIDPDLGLRFFSEGLLTEQPLADTIDLVEATPTTTEAPPEDAPIGGDQATPGGHDATVDES